MQYFLLCIVGLALSVVSARDGPLVTLKNGVKYQGNTEHDGDSFKGIRYGVAPVGKLRYAPPQMYAPSPEDGTIDATKLGHVCPQSSCMNTGCSEDCLLLNIFTAENATANALASGNLLPVVIFVVGLCLPLVLQVSNAATSML